MKSYLSKTFLIFVFTFIIFSFLFGRSFMGVYIFNFRIGEYLIGLCLLLTIYIFVNFKSIFKKQPRPTFTLYTLLITSYFFSALLTNSSLMSTYTYKSSSYILTISCFFIASLFLNNKVVSSKFVFTLQFTILYVYVLSTIYFPKSFIKFFENYSDKFDFNKAASLALFFLATVYLSNRTKNLQSYTIGYFFILSAIFLPLLLYKSRGSFLAILLFVLFELFNMRGEIVKYPLKNIIFFVIAILIFVQSSFDLTDNEFKIEETSNAVSDLLDQKNTNVSYFSFYYTDSRLYSLDYNVNWRIQIWQDVINDSLKEKTILFGNGYQQILPAMDNPERQGRDGTNENVHNFIINMYGRGGIVQVFLYLAFIGSIYFNFSKGNRKEFITVVIPVFIISFFDSSMENAHFPVLFYTFLGYVFNQFNDKNKIRF